MTHARVVFARQKLVAFIFFLGKSGIFLNFRLRPVHGRFACSVDCIPFKPVLFFNFGLRLDQNINS